MIWGLLVGKLRNSIVYGPHSKPRKVNSDSWSNRVCDQVQGFAASSCLGRRIQAEGLSNHRELPRTFDEQREPSRCRKESTETMICRRGTRALQSTLRPGCRSRSTPAARRAPARSYWLADATEQEEWNKERCQQNIRFRNLRPAR